MRAARSALLRASPPNVAGRWSATPQRAPDLTRRTHALAEALLDRYGVVTRDAVMAEGVPGGYAAVYRVLRAMEDAGRCRRGYFVEGLGAAQFALPGAVDRLRELARTSEGALRQPADESPWATPVPGGWRERATVERVRAVLLAATDPANPYGAALPWPERTQSRDGTLDDAGDAENAAAAAGDGAREVKHRPARKAGALVVLVDDDLALYVERGGKSLLTFTEDPARLQPAVDALALAVRDGALGKLAVERADGETVLTPGAASPLVSALRAAGFHATPRGLRLRA